MTIFDCSFSQTSSVYCSSYVWLSILYGVKKVKRTQWQGNAKDQSCNHWGCIARQPSLHILRKTKKLKNRKKKKNIKNSYNIISRQNKQKVKQTSRSDSHTALATCKQGWQYGTVRKYGTSQFLLRSTERWYGTFFFFVMARVRYVGTVRLFC